MASRPTRIPSRIIDPAPRYAASPMCAPPATRTPDATVTKGSSTSSWVSVVWGIITTCSPSETSAVMTTPASTIAPSRSRHERPIDAEGWTMDAYRSGGSPRRAWTLRREAGLRALPTQRRTCASG